MILKVIKWIVILFLVVFLMANFGCIEMIEEARGQPQAGENFQDNLNHTAIEGYSKTPQTTFRFDLSSPILHRNITLILYSERANSTYEVHAGNFEANGSFSFREELNFELQQGRKDFSIIIDGIQYRFSRTISEQAMPGDYQKEIDRADGSYYTTSEITILTARILGVSFAAFAVATPIAGYFVKKQSEEQVYEVI